MWPSVPQSLIRSRTMVEHDQRKRFLRFVSHRNALNNEYNGIVLNSEQHAWMSKALKLLPACQYQSQKVEMLSTSSFEIVLTSLMKLEQSYNMGMYHKNSLCSYFRFQFWGCKM